MSQIPMKKCKGCGVEKPLETDYYKAGHTVQVRCRPCHNEKRTADRRIKRQNTPKPPRVPRCGFAKLPEEVQAEIKADLAAGSLNKKQIAAKHGIKYPTFCLWVKKGL